MLLNIEEKFFQFDFSKILEKMIFFNKSLTYNFESIWFLLSLIEIVYCIIERELQVISLTWNNKTVGRFFWSTFDFLYLISN